MIEKVVPILNVVNIPLVIMMMKMLVEEEKATLNIESFSCWQFSSIRQQEVGTYQLVNDESNTYWKPCHENDNPD